MLMRLITEPSSHLRSLRAPRSPHRLRGRHTSWPNTDGTSSRFGVDRRVAEQRAKMWWQDRRQAAGHRLQDVAPEGLHPRRMMVIDKKVQLSQELARINPQTASPAMSPARNPSTSRAGSAPPKTFTIAEPSTGYTASITFGSIGHFCRGRPTVPTDHWPVRPPSGPVYAPSIDIDDVDPVMIPQSRRNLWGNRLASQRPDRRPDRSTPNRSRAIRSTTGGR